MSHRLAALALAGMVAQAPAGQEPPARWLGVFPALPGAHRLCSDHVIGESAGLRTEIAFTLYATTRDARETVRFYADAQRIRVAPLSQTVTVNEGDTKVLSVYPVSGKYPECGVKPGRHDRAVIVVSEKISQEMSTGRLPVRTGAVRRPPCADRDGLIPDDGNDPPVDDGADVIARRSRMSS